MLNHNVNVVSVSQLNVYLKSILDSNPILNNLLVKGEISNLKYYPNGHIYFSLKDEEGVIKCVMFSSYASKLSFRLAEGEKIIVSASLSLYGATGVYQLYVKSLEKDGLGNLYLEYERLKKELSALGLFDESHKKRLPLYPLKIGIISGKTAAGLRDIITIIKRRWPIAQIIVFPCLVQGKEAPGSIMNALKMSEQYPLDVTILARGGGSQEDLWCFNDKDLAYAIYNYKIPIVTGVGHEIDFTIADLVADYRAPTPSGAAEIVTPVVDELLSNIKESKVILLNRAKHAFMEKRTTLLEYQNYLSKEYFDKLINDIRRTLYDKKAELRSNYLKFSYIHRNKIKENYDKIKNEYDHYLATRRNTLMSDIRLLDNISPLKVLQRGYSVVSTGEGTINSISKINVDEMIKVTMCDGKLYAIVTRKDGKDGK